MVSLGLSSALSPAGESENLHQLYKNTQSHMCHGARISTHTTIHSRIPTRCHELQGTHKINQMLYIHLARKSGRMCSRRRRSHLELQLWIVHSPQLYPVAHLFIFFIPLLSTDICATGDEATLNPRFTDDSCFQERSSGFQSTHMRATGDEATLNPKSAAASRHTP